MKDWLHVFEPAHDEESELAGTWGEKVILELACGKGFYTLELARRHPDTVVVGVDIKGSRLWHGARAALDEDLENAKFLRTRIEDMEKHFAPAEVDEIWITFPDPHLREGKERKRLTYERFLNIYKQLLKPGGRVHLKTDSTPLYDWSRESFLGAGWEVERDVPDVYVVEDELLHVKTDYERRFLKEGKLIRYLCAISPQA